LKDSLKPWDPAVNFAAEDRLCGLALFFTVGAGTLCVFGGPMDLPDEKAQICVFSSALTYIIKRPKMGERSLFYGK